MAYRPAVCALVCAASVLGQVSVREGSTRAHLVDGKTTISLALTNTASKPLEAIVLLEWLDPDDHRDDFARRAAPIPPGESVLEIPLPLSEKFDPLLERLRYEIRPGGANYTAFSPVRGALSFPTIADYAFTLSVLTAELPRLGRPYEIRVLTFHPLTGRPMGGVKVRSEKNEAVSDQDGVALLRIPAPANPDEDSLQFGIEAALGDFRQNSETTSLPFAKDDVRIYTDKPIYQPGQTMHIRILALSGAGGVRAGIEHQVRIKNENNETVHAATLRTSRFGIASTDWEIPANAKAGEYDIEVERDATSTRRSSARSRYAPTSCRLFA